jgi:uncharacterized protein YbjT (DUF2867 family)
VRLLVIGASGQCGRWVARLAAARRHTVTALVRPTTRYEPPAAVVVERGDVLDAVALVGLMRGHDAVLSCIGPQRYHPANPWSAIRPPPRIGERSATSIVSAMRSAGVGRVVAISAAGVGDSASRLPLMMHLLVATSSVGAMYDDLEQMEGVYRRSGLEWTAVRPVTLVDGDPTSRTRILDRYRMTSTIARADVARWMLDLVDGRAPDGGRTPMIGWGERDVRGSRQTVRS